MFIGWIPTIQCDLFFEFSNPSLCDYDRFNINLQSAVDGHRISEPDDSANRRFAVSACIDWQDTVQGGVSGEFRILASGEVLTTKNGRRKAVGTISLLNLAHINAENPDRNDLCRNPSQFEKRAVGSLAELRAQLKAASRTSAEDTGRYLQELRKSWRTLRELTDKSTSEAANRHYLHDLQSEENRFWARFKFEISSDGVVELSVDSIKNGTDHKDEKFILARQAYHFLKYTFHKHKHHSHDAESLMSVVAQTTTLDQALWELHRHLTRGAINCKRAGTAGEHQIAGIIAYSKSLESAISARAKMANHNSRTIPSRLESNYAALADNTIASLFSRQNHADATHASQRERSENIRNLIMLIIACVAPLVILTMASLNGNEALEQLMSCSDEKSCQNGLAKAHFGSLILLICTYVGVFLYFVYRSCVNLNSVSGIIARYEGLVAQAAKSPANERRTRVDKALWGPLSFFILAFRHTRKLHRKSLATPSTKRSIAVVATIAALALATSILFFYMWSSSTLSHA